MLVGPLIILFKEVGTHPAMHIVCLGLLIEFTSLPSPMDHAAIHWYSLFQDSFNKAVTFGISHGVDPAL